MLRCYDWDFPADYYCLSAESLRVVVKRTGAFTSDPDVPLSLALETAGTESGTGVPPSPEYMPRASTIYRHPPPAYSTAYLFHPSPARSERDPLLPHHHHRERDYPTTSPLTLSTSTTLPYRAHPHHLPSSSAPRRNLSTGTSAWLLVVILTASILLASYGVYRLALILILAHADPYA